MMCMPVIVAYSSQGYTQQILLMWQHGAPLLTQVVIYPGHIAARRCILKTKSFFKGAYCGRMKSFYIIESRLKHRKSDILGFWIKAGSSSAIFHCQT